MRNVLPQLKQFQPVTPKMPSSVISEKSCFPVKTRNLKQCQHATTSNLIWWLYSRFFCLSFQIEIKMDTSEYDAMGPDGGVFRSIARQSMLRANIFALECVLVVGLYGYFLVGHVNLGRREILFLFGIIYMVRLNIMARWLLPRELSTEELTVVVVWICSILASIAVGAAWQGAMSNVEVVISFFLYFVGSWLNSWSELQRKWWKARPENKGHCYMLGLFSLSRNINYFGDVVLFGGWAIASGCWWNVWIPVAMAAMFYFYHIPDKEMYLRERYKAEWPNYVAATKSFIPFVC